jgi:hypothetical protein
MSRKADREARVQEDAAVEIEVDAFEAEFFAAEAEAEEEWGDEVEEGVFVDVPVSLSGQLAVVRADSRTRSRTRATPRPPLLLRLPRAIRGLRPRPAACPRASSR